MGTEAPAPSAAIDTANMHMVARNAKGIVVIRPPLGTLTDEAALNLAAWLVAMVEPDKADTFPTVLHAVRNT